MRTEMLDYHLPKELIAQNPAAVRGESRLLVVERAAKRLTDSHFGRLCSFLCAGDCLVLNDTKVLPARFFGRRRTGARFEGLFLSESPRGLWQVMIKGGRRLKTGESIYLMDRRKDDLCTAVLRERTSDAGYLLEVPAGAGAQAVLERIGFTPLPPYIKRNDDLETDEIDRRRYQTVYARAAGAVAAPTAGLHFTDDLIGQLKQAGVAPAYITLHVGAGTFKPVATENLEDHHIHAEYFSINAENARIINTARQNGGRIIPVGTTSVRTLETIASGPGLGAASGTTDLFITPGYKFKMTDAMITNFHLPKSTLLALVAAFAGLDETLAAYKHAIDKKYRFYSYGDAMLIT